MDIVHLMTAWTVVKSLGEFFTSEVKMNSNLDVNFARTHSACVRPRNLLFAFRIFTEIIELRPMLRLILEFAWAIHKILRFVTMREPRSPLFPFVSSTEFIESITFSPRLQASRIGLESNLSSLSCQIYSTTFSLVVILNNDHGWYKWAQKINGVQPLVCTQGVRVYRMEKLRTLITEL
jgi:hypothetical protein